MFSLVKYKPLTYNKVYEYPDWSIGVGWCLALASMICIPMVVVVKIIQSDGSLIEVNSFIWFVRNKTLCWCAVRGTERTEWGVCVCDNIESLLPSQKKKNCLFSTHTACSKCFLPLI